MQSAQAQRADVHVSHTAGADQLQPGRRAGPLVLCSLGDQQAHPAREPAGADRQDGLAGRVQPLHIVDRHQDGRVLRQAVDDRGERRGDDGLVGRRTVGGGSQQHPVDGEALNLRQLGENRRFDAAEEVGQRRVGEHRFGLPRPRGQHAEATVPRLGHPREPEGGLADARRTLHDEPGRLPIRG